MTRRGPRPQEATREAILEAARNTFADLGFDRGTMRAIAAAAGVDPALIHHYFGTKEELFAAAVHLPLPPDRLVDEVFADGVDQAGRRLSEMFFRVWETPEARQALTGQLRLALAGGEPPLRDFLSVTMLPRVASRLRGTDRKLRASLAASHLVGVALARYVIRLEPLASAPVAKIVELVAPRVQGYLEAES